MNIDAIPLYNYQSKKEILGIIHMAETLYSHCFSPLSSHPYH